MMDHVSLTVVGATGQRFPHVLDPAVEEFSSKHEPAPIQRRKCIGVDKGQWKICNPQPCPAGTKYFRQFQCEEIDPTYVAYFDKAKCSLICRKGQTAFPQGKHVKDGTRCTWDPNKRDVCIMGRCKSVGCDYELESGKKRDRCGICDGDSSKCQQVEIFWNEHCPGFGPGNACTILEVRVGSTSVYVEQDTADRNLLGVKSQESQYTWSRTVFAAGTKIHYYHEQDYDINKIYIPRPTTETLTIVFVPGYPKTGVLYRLFDPTLSSTVGVEHVQWKVSAWVRCSRKCAKGKRRRSAECARIDDGSHVGDTLCLRKGNKPATERPCNTQPCQPEKLQRSRLLQGRPKGSRSTGLGEEL